MGFFQKIFGGLASDVGGIASNILEPIMKTNLKYTRQARQTSYQDLKKSSIEAGINPILGTGNASSASSMTTAGADTGTNLISSALNMKNYIKQNQLLQAQIDKTKAETTAIEGDPKTIAGTVIKGIKNGKLGNYARTFGNAIGNLQKNLKNAIPQDKLDTASNLLTKVFNLQATHNEYRNASANGMNFENELPELPTASATQYKTNKKYKRKLRTKKI